MHRSFSTLVSFLNHTVLYTKCKSVSFSSVNGEVEVLPEHIESSCIINVGKIKIYDLDNKIQFEYDLENEGSVFYFAFNMCRLLIHENYSQ